MAHPTSLLPPRKLYQVLRAFPSADTRARAALEFMRSGAGAQSGFLFQPKDAAIVVTASTGDRSPTPGMLEEAQRACAELRAMAMDDAQSTSSTISMAAVASAPDPRWHAPGGVVFERRPLGIHRDREWIMVGLVMLEVAAGAELQPIRHAHVAAICEAMLDAGDVQSTSVPT